MIILFKGNHLHKKVKAALKFILILGAMPISCSEKKGVPKNLIQPKLMQSIFWDNARASVYVAELSKKDSTINDSLEFLKLQRSILEHHHVSEELYQKSYKFYLEHPSEMIAVLDSLTLNKNKMGFDIKLDRKSADFQ